MSTDRDVTDQVKFDRNDDESLPLTQCACGKSFASWELIVGLARDYPTTCPHCGRKLYFTLDIRVYSVGESDAAQS